MESIVKGIEAFSPFLSSYPFWVRVVFAGWAVLSTTLVLLLVLVPRQKVAAAEQDLKTIEVLPKQIRSSWGHREVDRPILRGLHHLFSEPAVTSPGESAPQPRVVIVETNAFGSNYTGFRLRASSNFASIQIGEGFVERESGELVQLKKWRLAQALEFAPPATTPRDRLVAIFRIESTQAITDELLPSIVKLEIAKD